MHKKFGGSMENEKLLEVVTTKCLYVVNFEIQELFNFVFLTILFPE